jgi:hypothetical protein
MREDAQSVRFTVEGHDLPGLSCGRDLDGRPCDDVHVGLARRAETVDLVPGDAAEARWSFDVVVRHDEDGSLDYGGPFVHGRRGERSLGLRWVRLTPEDELETFRAAKLRLSDVDAGLVEQALARSTGVVARLRLTDDQGLPRCASVRPPDVAWSLAET